MTWNDAFKTITAALASVGTAGGIMWALSSWLGKVWASRILEQDRARHEADLERLRADLSQSNAERLAGLERELDIYREQMLKTHADKLTTYRLAADIVTDFVALFAKAQLGEVPDSELPSILGAFERERLRVYAYLAMLAPQGVMDAHDALVDYLLAVLNREEALDWARLRALSLDVLNCIREDVGLDKSAIEYRGSR